VRDPGLQPERTELAWRRTLLAIAVGALVSVRVLAPVLGDLAVATGIGGLVLAAMLWAVVHRRHRAVAAVFRSGAGAMPGGALLLALTLVTTAGAALALTAVLLHHP
jgi:hypothetical protein